MAPSPSTRMYQRMADDTRRKSPPHRAHKRNSSSTSNPESPSLMCHCRMFSGQEAQDASEPVTTDCTELQETVSSVSRTVPQRSPSSAELAESSALEVYATPTKVVTDGIVPGKGEPPEAPSTCCHSGCSNCVWIMYAEEMRSYYADGGQLARQEVMKIEDPNLRAFLLLEIG